MKDFYDLAVQRRSVRKYESKDIPNEDIEYFIKAAVTAPSGCNSQCWEFIAVKNKSIINKLAEAVEVGCKSFYEPLNLDYEYIENKAKAATFFKNAPLVIAVFMTEFIFYDPKTVEAFRKKGYDHSSMMSEMSYPDVLSVGAAVQNLLLAVHEKGYGACWMNEPTIAGAKINKILGLPEEYKFMSLIPIGVPAYTPRNKAMKDMHEVFKIID